MPRFHMGRASNVATHARKAHVVRSPRMGEGGHVPSGKGYSDVHEDAVMDVLEDKTSSITELLKMHRIRADGFYKVIAAAYDMGYNMFTDGDRVWVEKL